MASVRERVLAVTAGMLVAAGSAPRPAQAVEAAAVEIGPVDVFPVLGVSESYIDNYFWAPSNEQDTWVSMLLPGVDAVLDGGNQRYMLGYRGEVARVHSFQESDYSDHQLLGEAELDFTSRLRASLTGEYLEEHDDLGTERTEGAIAPTDQEPDEWHAARGGGVLSYGAPGARGLLELGGSYFDKTYDNNRTATRFRDLDQLDTRATFYWRVMPKTRALLEVRHADVDYERDAPGVPTLDSEIMWYYAGLTWDATARTTGAVRVGRVDRDYDSGARSDSEDFSWEAGVTWAPRTYSVFELTTSRTPQETDNGLTDSGYTRDLYALRWTHGWRPRIRTELAASYAMDDYDDFSREDEEIAARFDVRYAFRRWLDVGFGYVYDKNDSDFEVFEYERHALMLSVTGSL